MYGSGQWTIPDGYVASKFMKGGHRHQQSRGQCRGCAWPARSPASDHLRPGRADGLLRGHRPRRRVRAVGQQHGRDAPGAVLPPAGAAPEATRTSRSSTWPRARRAPAWPPTAAFCSVPDRPGHRQRDLPRDRSGTTGCTRRSCDDTCSFHEGQDRHRLRPGGQGSPSRTRPGRSRFERTASCWPTTHPEKVEDLPACRRASSATWPRSTPTPGAR